jgi:hypothetical protein
MNPDLANKNAEKASEKVATTLASVWSLVPSLTSLTPRGLRSWQRMSSTSMMLEEPEPAQPEVIFIL